MSDSALGRRFVEALARKDAEALGAVLHDEAGFRELLLLECDAFADREQVPRRARRPDRLDADRVLGPAARELTARPSVADVGILRCA